MFIGLNPSTANQTEDDPTIRRVKRFAKDWGYGGVYMMNCFPYCTAYPKELAQGLTCKSLVHNWLILGNIGEKVKEVIFAWGNFKEVDILTINELVSRFPNAKALQLNANGSPKHPLYVKADVVPVKFQSYIASKK